MCEKRRPYIGIMIFGVCVTVYSFFCTDILSQKIPIRLLFTSTRKFAAGNIVAISAVNQFADRVIAFNAFVSTLRVGEFKKQGMRQWRRTTSGKLDVVLGTSSGYLRQLFRTAVIDYLPQLWNHSNVKTVVLPWLSYSSVSPRAWSPVKDHSNMLIETYYKWSVDDKLCSVLETVYRVKMTHDELYMIKCNETLNDTLQQSSVGPHLYTVRFNFCLPSHFVIDMLSTFAYYMHIHSDALVTENGDDISGNTKLATPTCSRDASPSLPSPVDKLEHIPLYTEIFVITQLWGSYYYHLMIEVMPRVALCLDFLKTNPQIPIIAPEVKGRISELMRCTSQNSLSTENDRMRMRVCKPPGESVSV